MLNKTTWIVVSALIIGIGSAALAASEQNANNDPQELAAVANAKITPQQATAIAEKETGGKATASGIDNENGVVNYDVTINQAGARKQVLVDMQTGRVVKVAEETGSEGAEGDEATEGPETNDDGPGQQNEGNDQKKG